MTSRRLYIRDQNGRLSSQFLELDGVANANASAPLSVSVQEECSYGAWHEVASTALPCWAESDPVCRDL